MLHGLSGRALRFVLAAAVTVLPALVTTSPAAARARVAGFAASCPAAGFISDPYGGARNHDGIDIANDYGTPIYAAGDGEVINSGPAQGYGQWIRILHPDGTVTEYGHMYRRDVAVGDRVTAGQQIALMGAEGEASGPHLHLRVRRDTSMNHGIDPVPYLGERGVAMPCTPGGRPAPAPLVYPVEPGRVVSARSADGRLEIFAAGADGVHHAWQTQVNGGWSEWERLGGPGNAQLAIAPNADGRLEAFAVNGDTAAHRYQLSPSGAWSNWEEFGTGGSAVAAGVNADGRIEVFASGPKGVFHRYQTAPNSGWSGWEPTGGGPAAGRVKMEKAPDGRLEVFALNGSVFQHQYQTAVNGAWSQWEDFGDGGHDLTVDHNADGRLEVFASGPVGVFHRYQTNPTSWSGWEPARGPADSRLTSDRTADGRVEVFAITGGAAAHIWQKGLNAAYSDWDDFGTGGSEITAATNADGRIEVFGTSRDGVLHKWQTGFSTWSQWARVNSTSGPPIT
ncbi:peptidoglycan DD-metalloendopeptidase family protein [Streptomyces roseoverticillatus]|uniref:peptidoglycan DD-metalloendopeptidase family protein n=1 Tax=Streptomyces roseoverticillatus TaxID=66429 RepID=UPI0004C1255D|nr:peptidoglycan DD-metalloendopeptidase family protein [Streptomyces roseoverticillatus]